jgi:uncharacterized protein YbaA (DUF1428 family)
MAHYVDGFLLAVPKDKLEEYRDIATVAETVWREHGALDYRECVGDDLHPPMGLPFPTLMNLQPDETVVFAWIVYPSREERDRINAAVMSDPRIKCDPEAMPFDCQRMAYGGFRTIVGS